MAVLFTGGKHPKAFEIDDEDLAYISKFSWHISGSRVSTTIYDFGKETIYLHIMLMGYAPEGLEWDHIDRNPMNNKKNNLRVVTRRVNSRNRNVRWDNTSGVSGINKIRSRWRVRISVVTDGFDERLHIGDFDTLEEAIMARRKAEEKYWKEVK